MYTNIIKLVKKKFFAIYNRSITSAEQDFAYIIKEIKNKKQFESIRILQEKLEKTDQKISQIEYVAYREEGIFKDELFELFLSRTILLNVDDTHLIEQAIYHSTLKKKILHYLKGIKKEIQPYGLIEFEMGLSNSLFFNLDYTDHISNEDLKKIRSLQLKLLLMVIEDETRTLIQTVTEKASIETEPFKSLIQDIKQYKKLLKKNFKNVGDLTHELRKFSFLKNYKIANPYRKDALLYFENYRAKKIEWKLISVGLLKKHFINHTSDHPSNLSNPPFIFYSIQKVIEWMSVAVQKANLEYRILLIDFAAQIEKIEHEAKENLEKEKEEYQWDIRNSTEKEIKLRLFQQLEYHRRKYISLGKTAKKYYRAIKNDNVLFEYSLNIFCNNNPEKENRKLSEALILHYCISYFTRYSPIQKVIKKYYGSMKKDIAHEIILLSRMLVLDNELHTDLQEIKQKYKNENDDLPYFMVRRNYTERLDRFYNEITYFLCIDFENSELNRKFLFINTRIKELRRRELYFIGRNRIDGKKYYHGYTTALREFLDLEEESISNQKRIDIKFPDIIINEVVQEPLVPMNKPKTEPNSFSFGFKLKHKKVAIESLLNLINNLNANTNINLLNIHQTSPKHLLEVLIADNLEDIEHKIHFNCETTQLRYILEKLSSHFSNLTYANIQRSSLFYTKRNRLLRADNLYSSRIDFPKHHLEIDKAFLIYEKNIQFIENSKLDLNT